MRPVDQIRTGFGRGQCTEASIASLLEVGLEDVPDLWTGAPETETDPEAHQPMANRMRLWWWLQERHGVMLVGGKLPRPTTIREAWRLAEEFMLHHAGFGWLPEDHLAIGPNPDGVSHQVVCCRGKLMHDPNPSRRGITGAQWIEWLVPLDRVPESARGMPCAEWRVEYAAEAAGGVRE